MTRRADDHPPAIQGAALAVALCLVMLGVYALKEPSALTALGVTNLLDNAVVLALAAAGLTLVVLAGELDLSSAGVIAITNSLVATVSTRYPAGPLLALTLSGGIGLVIGLVNALLVTGLGLQSLACTLGTMIACQGVALLVLAAPGGEVAEAITNGLTGAAFGAVPVAAVVLALVAGGWLLFRRTPLGIALYAVGTDETAARLSGIDAARAKLAAFGAAGATYGLAGFMLAAETGTGDPRVSGSFLLYVFAAVAIGGTSLAGGRGGVVGSLAGAGILTVMQKMLFALGVAEFYTNIFNGAVMIVAILVGRLSPLLSRWYATRSAGAAPEPEGGR